MKKQICPRCKQSVYSIIHNGTRKLCDQIPILLIGGPLGNGIIQDVYNPHTCFIAGDIL